jgi:ABC-type polysaccharide/polyol phosphate export permease
MEDRLSGVAFGGPFDRLGALIIRERMTRFSGGALSSLWAYLMPVGWIVVVVVAFRLLGRTTPIHADPAVFVATGILPYAVFRQTISSLMRAAIANRYLVYLRPVDTTEVLVASAVTELLNMLVLAGLVFGGTILLLAADTPADVLRVLLGLSLAWALGAGVGQLASALGQWSDTLARTIPLALRPMFWLSGVFFTATELGGGAQAVLWWNPLFHAIELLREGYFLGYRSPISSVWYPALIALGCHLVATAIQQRVHAANAARHRI